MQLHLKQKLYDKELIGKAASWIKSSVCPDELKEVILSGLNLVETTNEILREKNIALDKLKSLAFPVTEKTETLFGEDFQEIDLEQNEDSSEPQPIQPNPVVIPFPRRKRRSRLMVHAETEKQTVCVHGLQSGDLCTVCRRSRLYHDTPRTKTLVVAARSVYVIVVEQEVLRCRDCAHTEAAPLPEMFEHAHEGVHISAIASFADLRYRLGMPSLRIEQLTASAGVFVSDSVQFRLFEWAAAVVFPIFRTLKVCAANAKVAYRDDSPNRIIRLRSELKRQRMLRSKNPDKIGINTTLIRALTADKQEVALFFTTNSHAGEQWKNLLRLRDEEDKIISMSDALASNHAHDVHNKTTTALCLVHMRRNFYELRRTYPADAKFVLLRMREVFRREAWLNAKQIAGQERLAFHQKHSAPLMEELHTEALRRLKQVEPNSYIASAWKYLINHWEGLTQFLRVPDAPLHNNLAEQSLKVPIRHRKNSLSFQTENGALVGDVLTSLLYTAQLNNLSPQLYLETLLLNRKAVRQNPELWLPWSEAVSSTQKAG
jgi:transposase